MTSNQIAYQNLQETIRHNKVTEETERGKVLVQAYDVKSQTGYRDIQGRSLVGNLLLNYENLKVNQAKTLLDYASVKNQRDLINSQVALNEMRTVTELLDAQTNRINAQANRMNAESNRMNAETNRANYYNNYMQALSSLRQANAAWSNASTNYDKYLLDRSYLTLDWAKYGLNSRETAVKEREQLVKEEQLNLNRVDTIAGVFNSVGNLVGSASKIGGILAGVFG